MSVAFERVEGEAVDCIWSAVVRATLGEVFDRVGAAMFAGRVVVFVVVRVCSSSGLGDSSISQETSR